MLNPTQQRRTLRPLRNDSSASTVALRELVAALGPERAEEVVVEEAHRKAIGNRIRDLRNASPQTNRSIADYVGVGERAVAQWVAGGGIAWENAKKVAELFGVDPQWIWTGRDEGQALSGDSDRLARIEEVLERMEARQVQALSIVGEIRQNQQGQRRRRKQPEGEQEASGE